jgi:hypothetical protein
MFGGFAISGIATLLTSQRLKPWRAHRVALNAWQSH